MKRGITGWMILLGMGILGLWGSPARGQHPGEFAPADSLSRPVPIREWETTLLTEDGLHIRATVYRREYLPQAVPAVVLIHQGGGDRRQWRRFARRLARLGYLALAYDVRGHGESDRVSNLHAVFNDPSQAPRDLAAVLEYLRRRPEVNHLRVAVVGASIGGNLAALATSELKVKTAVAISPRAPAVFRLAGKKRLHLRSVFYISSIGDQQGRRAVWAKELYQQTAGPRAIELVEHSDSHGMEILRQNPRIEQKIVRWLQETL